MPKVAFFFFILLLSPMLTNSHAFIPTDLNNADYIQNQLIFDSDIIEIDSDFFTENNFKRYLIFGTDLQKNDLIKSNSIYGIHSDAGFFYVSVLSDKSAFNLVSQGYHVIEDFKLDFHSLDDEIQDASRIGDITGSSLANKKYDASGNGTVIAIVDTGVDFSNLDIPASRYDME